MKPRNCAHEFVAVIYRREEEAAITHTHRKEGEGPSCRAKILKMMEDNKQLALRIDGAIQSASQEVTNLRSELTATNRRLAELNSSTDPSVMENNQHNTQGLEYGKMKLSRSGTLQMQEKYTNGLLLREEVSQLQDEVHLLRQMKEMLAKDLEESHDSRSAEVLSATELKVQLAQKEQELARAKESLQAMKADRKRLKTEKTDLVSQMEQLYATLESREEQLRDFIRNYEQHRKVSSMTVPCKGRNITFSNTHTMYIVEFHSNMRVYFSPPNMCPIFLFLSRVVNSSPQGPPTGQVLRISLLQHRWLGH
ncbi:hypothetical protein FKM82_013567 [Ascaphus truei]